MDYREAINLAKKGKEEGFKFLYENTYKSKYYLAIKYMKDEQKAQDLLQEAYIKAFTKLDQLEKPETFPSWLGIIVGNLAKNMLQKKNPLLFSDVAVNDEDEPFEYEIEDTDTEYLPELSYGKQETQQLVHEMINSLSEEQRICILMYEIEGIPIKQIAAALDCSENTVKSRLNYGRKNLKKKAEELQKKGYKLYGLSALPLLLYLLKVQEVELSANGAFIEAGQAIEKNVFMNPSVQNITKASSGIQHVAKKGINAAAKSAVKSGFIHTAAGKAVAIIASVCILGGAIYGTSKIVSNSNEDSNQAPVEDTIQSAPEPTVSPEIRELTDEDYPKLIAGALTREEVEFVLAYGPQEIPEQGFEISDYIMLLNSLCMGAEQSDIIESYGVNENWESQYSVEDINRIFSVFTDYRFEESGASDGFIRVDGNTLTFSPSTLNYTAAADITESQYSENEIEIYYTYQYTGYERPSYTLYKKAVLEPNEDDLYQIVRIEEVEQKTENAEDAPLTDDSPDNAEDNGSSANDDMAIKQLYANVLDGLESENAMYYLYDINADGIQDLLVGTEVADGPFIYYDFHVYSCEKQAGSYVLNPIRGSVAAIGPRISEDGDGLYSNNISRGTGDVEIFRITIKDNELVTGSVERVMKLGTSEYEAFNEASPTIEWISISDRSALETGE